MKRLTYIKCPHWWHQGRNPTPYSCKEPFQVVCDRLGKIEDILGDDYDLERLKVVLNQCMTLREEVKERFGITKNTPINRLRELVEADRDGRCYIANVKVGERVFVPDKDGKVIGCRVQGISLPAHGKDLIIHIGGYPAEYLWSDREGIDWWKTYEAAGAALKGEQDGKKYVI